ncbi:hypothetical protein EVAR_20486_1 [Eumeta japonica]|uniref:Uncharacterized protein n=1 Tax=Eumeta variegata TaxID=151549 RepID=A0A4C1Y665_EUMVA|nr:hypothetical protein EVAR_20486_1 [Eumeta japonica]
MFARNELRVATYAQLRASPPGGRDHRRTARGEAARGARVNKSLKVNINTSAGQAKCRLLLQFSSELISWQFMHIKAGVRGAAAFHIHSGAAREPGRDPHRRRRELIFAPTLLLVFMYSYGRPP